MSSEKFSDFYLSSVRKSDTSCEWAPYRQSGGTDGYRCNCEDGFYGWKCELRLIFLLQKKVQSIFPHILKIFISACSTDRTGCHPVGTEKCEPAHMCRNSFSCDTVSMKRFDIHQWCDKWFWLASIWFQVRVVTWDVMIIIKSMSQERNAIASQDGMVLHVTKIRALQNHVKMQEYAKERSQNRETNLMTSYTAKYSPSWHVDALR